MSTTIGAVPFGGIHPPQPGANLAIGNIPAAAKIAEKTVELTACAQFGCLFGVNMVWFGLTQKQERQYGFDAATNLGGRAFILQFKVSATIPQTGAHAGQRRFTWQHHQMDQLVTRFGGIPNACFYFLPDIGLFSELVAVNGDLLRNSYLVDVADLPNPVPATHRKSGYHYAYLDVTVPEVDITSKPFKANRVFRASELPNELQDERRRPLPLTKELLRVADRLDSENARLADLFYRNAALVVLPETT